MKRSGDNIRDVQCVPVSSGHANVLKVHLTRGLHIPAHLVLFAAEAEALGLLGHQHRGDRLTSAAHHQVPVRQAYKHSGNSMR